MTKIRIISNGNSRGTQIIDCDTGKPINGITRLVVTCEGDGIKAEMTQICQVVGIDAMVGLEKVNVVPASEQLRNDHYPLEKAVDAVDEVVAGHVGTKPVWPFPAYRKE